MVSTRIAVLALVILVSGCAPVEDEAVEDTQSRDAPTSYSAETFYKNINNFIAGGRYGISPDGKELLITSDATGIFNSYSLELETGEKTALTTSDDDAMFAVSYFPDGKRYLYTSDKGGNEISHLFVGGPDTETVDLVPNEDARASFVGWIEDGDAFVVMTNERDPRFHDLYRYDSDTYERNMILRNDMGFDGFRVSPDGSVAALYKPGTSADNNLYLAPLAAEGEPELITAHGGDVSHGLLGFTPEGDKFVYTTDEFGEFTQAWTYDLNSGERKALVGDDWDVVSVSYSPSGRYRIHATNEDASTKVSITERGSGQVLELPDGLPRGNIDSVEFTPDEASIVLRIDSDIAPGDIFVVDVENQSFTQLTESLNPDIDPADLVESSVVRYKSFDGLEIPAILYKPKGASPDNPVPALVLVHGGPGGQSTTGYDAEAQHLVNHGYAILAANNRGSSGYGKTFYHLDDRRHGEDDLDDIVYGRTYLESLDWVDNEKIGIWGGSYGGYMVMAALAFRPDAFEVGVNVFGVTNWERTLLSIPDWWEAAREEIYDELGDPRTSAERLRRISPLFHAQNIKKPVLIVQGANDPRVLQVESDEMVEAIRSNNVPVDYVLFPDEGHGFNKRTNRIAASDSYLAFLNKYLRGND